MRKKAGVLAIAKYNLWPLSSSMARLTISDFYAVQPGLISNSRGRQMPT